MISEIRLVTLKDMEGKGLNGQLLRGRISQDDVAWRR